MTVFAMALISPWRIALPAGSAIPRFAMEALGVQCPGNVGGATDPQIASVAAFGRRSSASSQRRRYFQVGKTGESDWQRAIEVAVNRIKSMDDKLSSY